MSGSGLDVIFYYGIESLTTVFPHVLAFWFHPKNCHVITISINTESLINILTRAPKLPRPFPPNAGTTGRRSWMSALRLSCSIAAPKSFAC
jgi:hypothetical protein